MTAVEANSAPIAPFSITKGTQSFAIREARPDDVDAISWAAGEAFINDAVMHYMVAATKPLTIQNEKDLRCMRDFYYLLFKACMIGGGRVIVAVLDLPSKDSKSDAISTIAAAAAWYPPKNRITPINTLKGGILRCMRNSGPLTLLRTTNDYEDGRHRVYKRAFKTKAMEVPVPAGRENGNGHKKLMKPNDTWYLHVVFTSKKYEGLGFLSTLMREGYAHMHRTTPGIPATLESSSTRSRDRYAHLGFELMEPQTILGAGKVTSLGIRPEDKNHARKQKEELTGVPYYNMVNWDPSKSLGHKEEKEKV